jgi:hypothetical protein
MSTESQPIPYRTYKMDYYVSSKFKSWKPMGPWEGSPWQTPVTKLDHVTPCGRFHMRPLKLHKSLKAP